MIREDLMQTPPILVSVCALLLLLGAAPERPEAGGRYQVTPAEGGAFLRLDTQTGTVSVCQRKEGRWGCEAVPDDRRALQGEISRLESENKELQGTIRRLEELLALPDPGSPDRRAGRSGPRFQVPSEEEVDRAMDYVERMMRKFRDRIRSFKNSDGSL
jgi:hypothetical protein